MNRCVQVIDGANDTKKICGRNAYYLLAGSSYCIAHLEERIARLTQEEIKWQKSEDKRVEPR